MCTGRWYLCFTSDNVQCLKTFIKCSLYKFSYIHLTFSPSILAPYLCFLAVFCRSTYYKVSCMFRRKPLPRFSLRSAKNIHSPSHNPLFVNWRTNYRVTNKVNSLRTFYSIRSYVHCIGYYQGGKMGCSFPQSKICVHARQFIL